MYSILSEKQLSSFGKNFDVLITTMYKVKISLKILLQCKCYASLKIYLISVKYSVKIEPPPPPPQFSGQKSGVHIKYK